MDGERDGEWLKMWLNGLCVKEMNSRIFGYLKKERKQERKQEREIIEIGVNLNGRVEVQCNEVQ